VESISFQNFAETILPVSKEQKDDLSTESKLLKNTDQATKGKFIELIADLLKQDPCSEARIQLSMEKIRQWLGKRDMQSLLTDALASSEAAQEANKKNSKLITAQDLLEALFQAEKSMESNFEFAIESSDSNDEISPVFQNNELIQEADNESQMTTEVEQKNRPPYRLTLNTEAFFGKEDNQPNSMILDSQIKQNASRSTANFVSDTQTSEYEHDLNAVKELLTGSVTQKTRIIESTNKQAAPLLSDPWTNKEKQTSQYASRHLASLSDAKTNSVKLDSLGSNVEESVQQILATESPQRSEKTDLSAKGAPLADKQILEPGIEKSQFTDFQASQESHDFASQSSHSKTAEVSASAKSSTSPQPLQPNDIIQQIVEKIQFKTINEQSEIKITLKPEFLGNIRLNISAENHQVAIKVIADSPAIKEMLETNLHQLKTEFVNNGLEISKFDVYVGAESQQHGQRENPNGFLKTKNQRKAQAIFRLDGSEDGDDSVQGAARNRIVTNERIDYYV
jgi:flagellar hook-length control protein FliK